MRFAVVGDDVLFGLATYAAGFRLAQTPGDIFAINWKGLPVPIEEVRPRGVKLFHPVKLSDPEAQARIRAYFRSQRAAELQEATSP
jgi:hypothetical protein